MIRKVAGNILATRSQKRDPDLLATRSKPAAWVIATLSLLIFCVTSIALFALTIPPPLHRDENQFIASAVLLSRHGLLPYRDYPYFHTPNLIFAYALLFRFCNHLLLVARLLSFSCALASVALVFFYTRPFFTGRTPMARFWLGAAAVGMVISNRGFSFACGKAWNHDVPLLLTLLSFAAYCRGLQGIKARYLATSGLLMGMAVGTRLTFAPTAVALIVVAFALPVVPRQRWQAMAAVLLGEAIGLGPTLWLFALAPGRFIFCNLQFPMLTSAYWLGMERHSLTAWFVGHQKAVGLLNQSMGGGSNILLFVAGVAVAWVKRRRTTVLRTEVTVLGIVVLFLWVGAAIPTPTYLQYYYEAIPFLVLLVACQLSRAYENKPLPCLRILTVVVATLALGVEPYAKAWKSFSTMNWQPLMVHESGLCAARTAKTPGIALTLEPVIALEGGLDIYPQYATGMFAMRVMEQLPAPEQRDLGFGENGLPSSLSAHPAAVVVTCPDTVRYDAPLLKYVASKNWRATPIGTAGEKAWSPAREVER